MFSEISAKRPRELLRRPPSSAPSPRRRQRSPVLRDRQPASTSNAVSTPRPPHGHALALPSSSSSVSRSMITLLRRRPPGHAAHRMTRSASSPEYNVYMVQLTFPMIAVGWVVNLFQRGTASIVRIDELLKAQPTITDAQALQPSPNPTPTPVILSEEALSPIAGSAVEGPRNSTPRHKRPDLSPQDASTLQGEIELPQPELLLRQPGRPYSTDINSAHPRRLESLAIVGPTGSGKVDPRQPDRQASRTPPPTARCSSTANPFAHLYPRCSCARNIGFVPQETFLFSDTIAPEHRLRTSPTQPPSNRSKRPPVPHTSATEILDFPKGFAHPRRRARRHPLRRPEAAHRHRTSRHPRPAYPHPGRRPRIGRHLHRRANPLRPEAGHARPHHNPHLPPHQHRPPRRPDRRPRRRPHRRARNPRPARSPQRLLHPPLPKATTRRRTSRNHLDLPKQHPRIQADALP